MDLSDLDLHLDAEGARWRKERQRQEWLSKMGFGLLCIAIASLVLSPFLMGSKRGGGSSLGTRGWFGFGGKGRSNLLVVGSAEEKRLLEDKIASLERALADMQQVMRPTEMQRQHLHMQEHAQELEARVLQFEVYQSLLDDAIVRLGDNVSALTSYRGGPGLLSDKSFGACETAPLNISALNDLEKQMSDLGHRLDDLVDVDSDAARVQRRVAALATILLDKTRGLRASLDEALRAAALGAAKEHAAAPMAVGMGGAGASVGARVAAREHSASDAVVCPVCPACSVAETHPSTSGSQTRQPQPQTETPCPPCPNPKPNQSPPCPKGLTLNAEPLSCPACPVTGSNNAKCATDLVAVSAALTASQKDVARARQAEQACLDDVDARLDRCMDDMNSERAETAEAIGVAAACREALQERGRELAEVVAKAHLDKGRQEVGRRVAESVDFASPSAGAAIDHSNTSASYIPPHWRVQALVAAALKRYGPAGDALSSHLPLAAIERLVLTATDWLGIDRSTGSAEDAISSDMSLGSCWPMEGSRGYLGVRLGLEVMVDRIAIEHIAR